MDEYTIPPPPVGLRCTAQDLWIVSQTVFGEASGEERAGQWAVAWVIRNRHEHHRRWQGQALGAICQAARQFSAWHRDNPRLEEMRRVSLDRPDFVACVQATVSVLGGLVPSNVGQATHYYAPALLATPPAWARGKTPVAVIGGHLFFEGIP